MISWPILSINNDRLHHSYPLICGSRTFRAVQNILNCIHSNHMVGSLWRAAVLRLEKNEEEDWYQVRMTWPGIFFMFIDARICRRKLAQVFLSLILGIAWAILYEWTDCEYHYYVKWRYFSIPFHQQSYHCLNIWHPPTRASCRIMHTNTPFLDDDVQTLLRFYISSLSSFNWLT